jgi:hypothetical protein
MDETHFILMNTNEWRGRLTAFEHNNVYTWLLVIIWLNQKLNSLSPYSTGFKRAKWNEKKIPIQLRQHFNFHGTALSSYSPIFHSISSTFFVGKSIRFKPLMIRDAEAHEKTPIFKRTQVRMKGNCRERREQRNGGRGWMRERIGKKKNQ